MRAIWAACLLLATFNHARILMQHGLAWDYGGVSVVSAVYWSSLTLLDPLVAALLFARPKIGVLLTITLIITNVVHNLAVTAAFAPKDGLLAALASSWTMISQMAFMLFVVATARTAWGRG